MKSGSLDSNVVHGLWLLFTVKISKENYRYSDTE